MMDEMNEKKNEEKEKSVEEKSMKEKIDELYSARKSKDKNNSRKLRIPRRAKVRKSRMKKGYCGILFLNETRCLSGQKTKLDGGTYRTKDNNIHVTNGKELIMWEGKYPVLWQRYDKLNPTNLCSKEGDKNEIYGQDSVGLRMKRDTISDKKKPKMNIVLLLIILGVGFFVMKTFFPNLFGG